MELMDPNMDLDKYINDAEALLSGVVDPEFYQREPEFGRQPWFDQAEVAWGQAPERPFREYPFGGNQWAPAQDWRQYDYHSGYGADSRRDRADVRGR